MAGRSFTSKSELINFGMIVLLILAGAFLVSLVEGIVSLTYDNIAVKKPWWIKPALFLPLLISYFLLYRYASRNLVSVFGSDVEMTNPDQETPRKIMITGYSPNKNRDLAKQFCEDLSLDEIALVASEFGPLAQKKYPEKKKYELNLNWQQNVRAVYPHRNSLSHILVLLPDGDEDQFTAFKIFMEGLLKKAGNKNVRVEAISRNDAPFTIASRTGGTTPQSYEDYDYVYQGLRQGLKRAQQLCNTDLNKLSRHVIVDTTPGVKVFSIAAAILTLNMNLKFSYVNNDGSLRFYDASLRFRFTE